MSDQSVTSGDIVTAFIYGRGKSRAECSCGGEGHTRLRRGRAVLDALMHGARTGCAVDYPLTCRVEGPSLWKRLTPAPVVAAMPLLLIPAGLWLAPVVHADTAQDAAFIETLDHFGIYYSSEAAAIRVGYAVCHSFDQGVSFMSAYGTAISAGMDGTDAAHEIGAAIGVYCPQHADLLGVTPGTAV